MMNFDDFFNNHGPRAAIFLSGSGSNAEHLLNSSKAAWQPVVLVTDYPETSRARELSRIFNIPLIEADIRKFYADAGLQTISLATDQGRAVRDQWTDSIRQKLAPFHIDFGILAGFVSLTNITGDFPCLNIHPGDLTYEVEGRRVLVGLHTLPVERAILAGLTYLRSSVIVTKPFNSEADIDSGPILGISMPIPIELPVSLPELRRIAENRPARKPRGGWNDELERIAQQHQERLKHGGDLKIYARVIEDFASGKFTLKDDALYYNRQPVKTVEYLDNGVRLIEYK